MTIDIFHHKWGKIVVGISGGLRYRGVNGRICRQKNPVALIGWSLRIKWESRAIGSLVCFCCDAEVNGRELCLRSWIKRLRPRTPMTKELVEVTVETLRDRKKNCLYCIVIFWPVITFFIWQITRSIEARVVSWFATWSYFFCGYPPSERRSYTARLYCFDPYREPLKYLPFIMSSGLFFLSNFALCFF